jgi:hypothetical protein
MVLAVYIVCDCPTDGDETCSRRDGEKPAFGKKYVNKIAESDATLATDHTCGFIETQNAIEAFTLDQCTACVETRIAVTSASAKGKQAARRSGIEDAGNLVIPSGFVYLTMRGSWIAAPGKNMLGAKRGWGTLAFGQARG